MPETKSIEIGKLSLDLGNYRMVPQSSEATALDSMILASPDRFWALTESLLRDGYLPTETILVLRTRSRRVINTVREGNRRVAALKLVHGLLQAKTPMPESVSSAIKGLSAQWLRDNTMIPCALYTSDEAKMVDRIVALTHGKGEKAGRDQWNAVARARHNREVNKSGEPALDLLEKVLSHAKDVTDRQRGHWGGDYPLTVLAEALKRLAPRLGAKNSADLVATYPGAAGRAAVESIVVDIGKEQLGFDDIRRKESDFMLKYNVPPASGASPATPSASASASAGGGAASASPANTTGSKSSRSSASGSTARAAKATSISDPRTVRRQLRAFSPRGKKREKVETLRQEAVELDIVKTPLAFCFVLRSMFEISAKAYCDDHAAAGLSSLKSGQDRSLADMLRDITRHLTAGNTDKQKAKVLHGSMAELGKTNGLLSVTSMNQLVHNPRFSITSSDLAVLFGNVYPLLEAMN